MKVSAAVVLAAAISIAVSMSASADIMGFVGPYDVTNWTTTLTGDPPGGGPPAGVDTSGAPVQVVLTGGDDGCNTVTVTDCLVIFSISAQNGFLQFDWSYDTSDLFGPSGDPFGYLVGSTLFQLTDDFGASSQSGTVSLFLTPGEQFGFYVDCLFCDLGAATATISNFAAPEPGSLALIVAALATGLGLARRRARAF